MKPEDHARTKAERMNGYSNEAGASFYGAEYSVPDHGSVTFSADGKTAFVEVTLTIPMEE